MLFLSLYSGDMGGGHCSSVIVRSRFLPDRCACVVCVSALWRRCVVLGDGASFRGVSPLSANRYLEPRLGGGWAVARILA